MKKIKIEYWGKYLELQVCAARDEEGNVLSEDEGYIDSLAAQWELDKIHFKIEGKEYNIDDFSTEFAPINEQSAKEDELPWVFDGDNLPLKLSQDLNVEEEAKKMDADYAQVIYNNDYGSIEIEIPENEEFDPNKVIIYNVDWIFPQGEIAVISDFVYNGEGYELDDDGGNVSYSVTLWGNNPNDGDNNEEDEDEDYDEDYDEDEDYDDYEE